MNRDCFTPKVLQADCDDTPITFLTTEIDGVDDRDNPPVNGAYYNTIVKYNETGNVYLYNSVGIPTQTNAGGVVDTELLIDSKNAVQNRAITEAINETNSNLSAEISNRENADTALSNRITDLDGDLVQETANREEADSDLSDRITNNLNSINTERSERVAADSALSDSISTETTDRENADTTLTNNLNSEIQQRQADVSSINTALGTKVDKAEGMGLSQNSFTDAEKTKLAGIATGAEVNVQSDWEQTDTESDSYIKNKPTKVSDFENDAGYQNASQVSTTASSAANTAASAVQTTIDGKINKVVVSDIGIDANTSTNILSLQEGKVNIGSGETSSSEVPLPVASSTQSGVMNSSTFNAVQNNASKIDILLHSSVAITGLSDEPIQEELTTAWENATSQTELVNGASIYDSTNNTTWKYFDNDSTWHNIGSGGGQVTVNQATNNSLGIVMGSENDGQAFVESDGTLSVNGWDTAMSNIANNTTAIAGKQDTLSDTQLAAANSGITASKVSTYDGYANTIAGKQDALTTAQLNAVNSGITSTKVNTYDGYASTIASKANTSDLATVATTGAYSDLSGKPTIPAAQVNSDWSATSGVSQILNKPTLSTVATSGSYNDLSNKPTIPTVNNGTLTIQQNGTSVGTFTANQSGNSTVNITAGTPNNGTLTIKKNGTSVGTFTANQSSASTANVETWVQLTQAQYNALSTSDKNKDVLYIITDAATPEAVPIDGSVTNAKVDWTTIKQVNYSTTEQAIGTWIDGSTLYRKTIVATDGIAKGTPYQVPHGISNLNKVIRIEGFCYNTANGDTFILGSSTGSVYAYVWVVTSSVVKIYSTIESPYPLYITLYYTKTS